MEKLGRFFCGILGVAAVIIVAVAFLIMAAAGLIVGALAFILMLPIILLNIIFRWIFRLDKSSDGIEVLRKSARRVMPNSN